MDWSKLIYGFLHVVTWICHNWYNEFLKLVTGICQSWNIDFLKLWLDFLKVVLCISRQKPSWNLTKLVEGESKYALGPLYLWQCLFSYFIVFHYPSLFFKYQKGGKACQLFLFITCLCENTSKRLQGTCLIFFIFHVCFVKTHVKGGKEGECHVSYVVYHYIYES